MGLFEDLRQLAEQVKRRVAHVKGEEATKQALIMPFLQVLGFDVYDPSEVQPEYIADFAKKRSNGQMEKVDYALRLGGQPVMFIECKPLGTAPEDHDGQLARYFNASPTVKVAVVTNGTRYRFFTDLHAPNVMDASPFLEFDLTAFTEREAENLRPFTKDGFNPGAVQAYAEELIFTERVTSLVGELLRNPSENFVRFLLGELDLVQGRVTAKVVERFVPIVRRAVQTTLLDMMTRSLQQEIGPPVEAPAPPVVAAPAAPPAPASSAPAPSPPTASATDTKPGEPSRQVVTTAEELEIFEHVKKICADSATKQEIAYKDTTTYFGINLGRVGRWFLRAYCNGSKKFLTMKVPVEHAQLLARGFEVEAPPEGMGKSRVYFSAAKDIEKLRPLVLMAYEEEVKRVASGASDDAEN